MNNLQAICPNCKFSYTIPLDRELARTLPQNSLYWGVYVKIIADYLGYFPDELHAELKLLFNPKDSRLVLGEKVGGTTTKMTRKEFTEYLEKIRIWAMQEHWIDLPEAEKKDSICKTAPFPQCNGAQGCDTCEHQEEE